MKHIEWNLVYKNLLFKYVQIPRPGSWQEKRYTVVVEVAVFAVYYVYVTLSQCSIREYT